MRLQTNQREKIAQIKQTILDKEPFDIYKLGEYYSLRGDCSNEVLITQSIIEEYEYEYYLKNPDLKTLLEYADHRKNLDRNDSN
jgi:hypothetical protein